MRPPSLGLSLGRPARAPSVDARLYKDIRDNAPRPETGKLDLRIGPTLGRCQVHGRIAAGSCRRCPLRPSAAVFRGVFHKRTKCRIPGLSHLGDQFIDFFRS